jgi:hypothetical protein
LWWPDTGRVERPAVYDVADGVTRIPIHFEPSGSVFVVFSDGNPVESARVTAVDYKGRLLLGTQVPTAPSARAHTPSPAESATAVPAVSVWYDAAGVARLTAQAGGDFLLRFADGQRKHVVLPAPPPPRNLTGPWTVRFDPAWGGPAAPVVFAALLDWSQHPEAGIRHYSGTGHYRTTFRIDATAPLSDPGVRTVLDLGRVAVMAEIRINGHDLGILWKPPFRVDVSESLRPGDNVLEVTVANLWVNRQIADEQLPPDSERDAKGLLTAWPQWLLDGKPNPTGRYTFSTWRLWKKDEPLVESGLLGPVTLQPTVTAALGR